MRVLTLIILVVGQSSVLAADDSNRPEPPDGFQWQSLEAVNGGVLVPEGWHFHQTSVKGTHIYHITPEQISKDAKHFRTGLTINVVQDVKNKSNAPPSIYAAKHVVDYRKSASEATEPIVDKVGQLQRITCFCTKKLPQVDPDTDFRIKLTTLANDKTDTLYVLTFGTPKSEWDANYEIGKQLFSPIQIDQSF